MSQGIHNPIREYTYCKYHGKQRAVGNWEECEMCLLENKEEQIKELERKHKVLGTVHTGEF